MGCLHFGVVRFFRCLVVNDIFLLVIDSFGHIFYNSSNCNSLLFLFLSFYYFLETEHEIFEEVLHGDLDFSSEPWPSISESAKDLVKRMLVRDPKKRLTAHQVLCKFVSCICFIHNEMPQYS